MQKSRDAFRTISEVADWLDTPAHVLRFWESKFSQIRPLKRAGGRRYYRPEDMELLSGIKFLLHEQGMTIKGAQKLLRENGIKHVASLGRSLDLANESAPTAPNTEVMEPSAAAPAEPRASTPIVTENGNSSDADTLLGTPDREEISNVVQMETSAPPQPTEQVRSAPLPHASQWQEKAQEILSGVDDAAAHVQEPISAGALAFLANQSRSRLTLRKQRIAPLYSRLSSIKKRISDGV